MAKRHIKGGTLTVSGATVKFRSLELTTSVEAVEVTDSGSGGHQEFLDGGGIERGEFSGEFFWYDDALPNSDPPNIKAGAREAFVLTPSAGKTFSGEIFIEEVSYNFGEVDGSDAIMYELTAQVSTPLVYPT